MSRPRLAGLTLAEEPAAWEGLGFAVRDGSCRIGSTLLDLAGAAAGEGIVGWTVAGATAPDGVIDGLPTAHGAAEHASAPEHPNGVVAIDHVVVQTPDVGRTCAALQAAGVELRATRDVGGERPLRQAFLLLAEALVEVVGPAEPAGDGPASFWGLTLVVSDLDAAADLLGERLGSPRDAVQRGRRIATVQGAAGLRTRLALMTPRH